MKILLLIDGLGSGGAQRQMVNLAILLKEKGYNVSFLAYSLGNFFYNELQDNGIDIQHCITGNYLSRLIKVRVFIRKGKYDAVISYMDVPNFINNFAAIGRKRWKVITSERSSKDFTFTCIQGKVLNWFQRFSDYIVCNSNNAKKMWQRHNHNYTDKLKVIYNPVVLPLIISRYEPKRNGKLNIVIAASYQFLKNPVGLVKAVSKMSNEEKEQIEINWFGEINVSKGGSKAYEESKSLISENNLEKIVYLNGPIKDISNKMNTADIIALFSELEGLPNAICEGMMIGKPVIMTKVSDYDNLVDNSNGFLCDWDNPESIKNALVKACNLSIQELELMG